MKTEKKAVNKMRKFERGECLRADFFFLVRSKKGIEDVKKRKDRR